MGAYGARVFVEARRLHVAWLVLFFLAFFTAAASRGGSILALGSGLGTNMPPFTNVNIISISAGYAHGLAVRAGGSVIAWGNNSYLQTNVPPDLVNVVAVAAGTYHSLALKADGTVI